MRIARPIQSGERMKNDYLGVAVIGASRIRTLRSAGVRLDKL